MSQASRYTVVAVALHWAIALAILANLALGYWMGGALDSPGEQARATAAFQLHKSIGLSVLVLSLLRLAWRFLYPPPPAPPGMRGWERWLATLTHWLFYGLMVGIPLSGWLYVSTQWRGDAPFTIPTLWFGLFEVPHLLALDEAGNALRQQLAAITGDIHALLVIGLLTLLALHVRAALRHQFLQRDGILARMLPGLPTPEALPAAPRRPAGGLRGVLAATATLAVAAVVIGLGTGALLSPGVPRSTSPLAQALPELLANADTQGPAWPVDSELSHIRFSGVHAGVPFEGHFGGWLAAIHFDPRAPRQATVAAVVDTASATDGIPLHDKTLPQGEWFDAAKYPHASFLSTAVTRLGDNTFRVTGALRIKDKQLKNLPLTLTIEGDRLTIEGTVELDRSVLDMGMESDPGFQYVSRVIEVEVETVAHRP